jgi:hypothetical protein
MKTVNLKSMTQNTRINRLAEKGSQNQKKGQKYKVDSGLIMGKM